MVIKDENVIDIQTYKRAKIAVKELAKIISFYDLAIVGLSNYTKYGPVAETIAKLKMDKSILQVYHKKCNNYINKGKKDG